MAFCTAGHCSLDHHWWACQCSQSTAEIYTVSKPRVCLLKNVQVKAHIWNWWHFTSEVLELGQYLMQMMYNKSNLKRGIWREMTLFLRTRGGFCLIFTRESAMEPRCEVPPGMNQTPCGVAVRLLRLFLDSCDDAVRHHSLQPQLGEMTSIWPDPENKTHKFPLRARHQNCRSYWSWIYIWFFCSSLNPSWLQPATGLHWFFINVPPMNVRDEGGGWRQRRGGGSMELIRTTNKYSWLGTSLMANQYFTLLPHMPAPPPPHPSQAAMWLCW